MPRLVPGSASGSLPKPRTPGIGDAAVMRAAFASAQAMWKDEFAGASLPYSPARLVFFGEQVSTACGTHGREVGPFYCPADHTVYLNTAFFDGLARAYGLASGFAAGYIVGHEVGHHVQQLLGVHGRVAALNANIRRERTRGRCASSCRPTATRGCGCTRSPGRDELKEGDVADILRAAAIVGDDFRQQKAPGGLTPETWTHGSSAQRTHWVQVGLQEGRPGACDTFSAG